MRSTERSSLIKQQVIDWTEVDNKLIGLTYGQGLKYFYIRPCYGLPLVMLSVILFLSTESERCSGSGSVKRLDSGIRVRDEKTGSVML